MKHVHVVEVMFWVSYMRAFELGDPSPRSMLPNNEHHGLLAGGVNLHFTFLLSLLRCWGN